MTDSRSGKVPLCIPHTDDAELAAMTEALRSGWLAHGPFNKKLEARFCELLGVEHAISMNSCTSALFLALVGNKIGGEVIMPSFTFVASANAAVTAGATPCLADIDERTCNVDPAAVEAKINDNTEALMVVHYAGQPADMTALAAIAEKHGLLLIEDSAETLDATWNGKQAGSFGVGCFSFFPTKNITTGEGGMLTTDDGELASACRALLGHGLIKTTAERQGAARPWFRDAKMAGYNFRMSNVLAAIGCAQFDKLSEITAARQRHAAAYAEALAPAVNAGHLAPPSVAAGATHSYQTYAVQLSDGARRDEMVTALIEQGIGASVHFDPPVHSQTFYKAYFAERPAHLSSELTRTETVSSRIASLPMYPAMQPADIARVAAAVNGFFGVAS